jgi:glutathione S-transferase
MSAAAAAAIKLYGVPLSQPFRAVAWSLLQHHVAFDVQLCVPGATSKIGSLHESFLAKSKTGTVPLLELDGVAIGESPVILSHLCEALGWNRLLHGPPGSARKVQIDSYLHWHHVGTRQLAKLSAEYLRPDLKVVIDRPQILQQLARLNDAWLVDDYIAGTDLSIADFLAYEEVAQLYMTGLLDDLPEYPKVHAWVRRMEQLPYHKEAHAALTTLGNLAEPNEMSMPKRLGAATKAGMEAYKQVQATYPPRSHL